MFINDLAVYVKSLDIGIKLDDDNVCILMYADDIVLTAESEHNLQILLNHLNDWCNRNDMSLNVIKSYTVHFRTESMPRSNFVFKCGLHDIKYVSC